MLMVWSSESYRRRFCSAALFPGPVAPSFFRSFPGVYLAGLFVTIPFEQQFCFVFPSPPTRFFYQRYPNRNYRYCSPLTPTFLLLCTCTVSRNFLFYLRGNRLPPTFFSLLSDIQRLANFFFVLSLASPTVTDHFPSLDRDQCFFLRVYPLVLAPKRPFTAHMYSSLFFRVVVCSYDVSVIPVSLVP